MPSMPGDLEDLKLNSNECRSTSLSGGRKAEAATTLLKVMEESLLLPEKVAKKLLKSLTTVERFGPKFFFKTLSTELVEGLPRNSLTRSQVCVIFKRDSEIFYENTFALPSES